MPHINDVIWYLSFLWLSNIPLSEKEVTTTPVFLPRDFHGQGSLAGYSPWDGKESNMTEWLTLTYNIPSHTHTHTHIHSTSLSFLCWWTLRLFPSLAFVNSIAVNIGVHVSFQIWVCVSSSRCPGVGLLDDIVMLFFVLWGTSMLFFIVVPIFIPTNSVGVLPFFHTLTSIYCS